MYFIEKTVEFDKWLKKLKDLRAKAKILFRIQKLETDEHLGDCKPVGEGIHELRIDYARDIESTSRKEKANSLFFL